MFLIARIVENFHQVALRETVIMLNGKSSHHLSCTFELAYLYEESNLYSNKINWFLLLIKNVFVTYR